MRNSAETAFPRFASEWSDLWKAKQAARPACRPADYWDKRSETFSCKDAPDSYVQQFLALADIQPGESVLDMGCGTGNLALPLAKEGHGVVAADFSQGMLNKLRARAEQAGLDSLEYLELAWEDDWAQKGMADASRDICLASRSIATNDLQAVLHKLTQVARRRVCVTLCADASPRYHGSLLRAAGVAVHPSFDDVFAHALLLSEGYFPSVSYISVVKEDVFDSFDEAWEYYEAMTKAGLQQFGSSDTPNVVMNRLRSLLEDGLVKTREPDGTQLLKLNKTRTTTWAFIAWNK